MDEIYAKFKSTISLQRKNDFNTFYRKVFNIKNLLVFKKRVFKNSKKLYLNLKITFCNKLHLKV